MPAEPQPWALQLAEWLAGIAIAASLGLLRLIAGKAGKEELAEAVRMLRDQHAEMLERVDEHYEEAKRSREQLYGKFEDVNKGLGATMVAVSRLQGWLERNDDDPRRRT